MKTQLIAAAFVIGGFLAGAVSSEAQSNRTPTPSFIDTPPPNSNLAGTKLGAAGQFDTGPGGTINDANGDLGGAAPGGAPHAGGANPGGGGGGGGGGGKGGK